MASEGGRIAAVTGASGFIGSHLVDALLLRGVRVRCLVRGGRERAWIRAAADVVDGSLADPAACEALVAGADIVFHVGGLGLRRLAEAPAINVAGTDLLLRACARGSAFPRFVLLSSIKAGLFEEDAGRAPPPDPYAESKWVAERLVAREAANGSPVIVVRAPAVYGPRDVNMLPFFRLASLGALPRIRGEVPPLSHVHVGDLAHFLGELAIAGWRKDARMLECGSSEHLDYNILVELLADWAGRGCRIAIARRRVDQVRAAAVRLPGNFGMLAALRLADILDEGRAFAAPVLARDPIPLARGIGATGNWYRSVGWL